MKNLELHVTLWPDQPHYERFATDQRIAGVRLNSAMAEDKKLPGEFDYVTGLEKSVPLYFDIKGRQLRVREVGGDAKHLELVLNHPISVETPTPVLFKGGEDDALLVGLAEGGKRLIFDGGPYYNLKVGESLHIRDPSLEVKGPLFLEHEVRRVAMAREAGVDRFVLSYVEKQSDIDEFRELIGDSELIAKIENRKGLAYVANEYRPQENLSLMAARGDLYVEVQKPHEILEAMRLIIGKDKNAMAGSRMLLSLVEKPVPSCSDLAELAWLTDIGYRRFLLCDDLCLKEEPLAGAVGVFAAFDRDYAAKYARKAAGPALYVPGAPATKTPSRMGPLERLRKYINW